MKVSDLMDDLLDDSITLEVHTPLSSKRIKELTRMKVGGKIANRRPAVRILLACAVIAAMTVSVFAAERIFGIGERFQSLFGGKLTQEQVAVIEELGTTFQNSVTSNGATITPIAAFADESTYYLHLRVEAPEGVVLPDDCMYQFAVSADNGFSLEFPAGAYATYGWEANIMAEIPDEDPTDNVKELAIKWTAQAGTDLKFNDGVSKRLTIPGLSRQIMNGVYEPFFVGDFQFEIGMGNDCRALELTVKGLSSKSEVSGSVVTLETMQISPLSIAYTYCYTEPVDSRFIPGVSVQVILSDGSEVKTRPGSAWVNDNSGGGYILFEEPVELKQIAYIQFCEHRILVDPQ